MAVLLLAEVTGGELQLDTTAKAVAAVKALGEVTALCCATTTAWLSPPPT
jgi:electron transfer flavoprotein alpha subunit